MNMRQRAGELSTNALAALLVVAILVSVGGTMVSLSKLRIGTLEALTGAATATTTVTVTNTTAITVTTSTVTFSNLVLDQNDDTTDANPPPFAVRNDGNVPINITINATRLFNGTASNTSSYRFKCRADEGPNCATGSPSSFTDMPLDNATLTNLTAVFDLPATDANDSRFVDIAVDVPSDEPGGSHSSTVTFTATQV